MHKPRRNSSLATLSNSPVFWVEKVIHPHDEKAKDPARSKQFIEAVQKEIDAARNETSQKM
jgi:hypothetical protein